VAASLGDSHRLSVEFQIGRVKSLSQQDFIAEKKEVTIGTVAGRHVDPGCLGIHNQFRGWRKRTHGARVDTRGFGPFRLHEIEEMPAIR
jgi:hypothetical protein